VISLPLHKHPFINADPFVFKKTEVVSAVKKYLVREGYDTGKIGKADGVDVAAVNEYHTLLIAAQGNFIDFEECDYENIESMLITEFNKQLVNLLQNHERNPAKTLVLANPDTPSVRKHVEAIKQALDDLGIVRFWVRVDGTIEWE
jgi:hypothetical protein